MALQMDCGRRGQGAWVAAALGCFVVFNLLVYSLMSNDSGRSSGAVRDRDQEGGREGGSTRLLMDTSLQLRGGSQSGPTRREQSLWSHLTDLVLVAGHSVYLHGDFEREDVVADDSWFLESFQRGQVRTFVDHIRKGVELAASNPAALLVFSGGETRLPAGPRSEAQSYWMVAEFSGWFGKGAELRTRAVTEEHARDSFENLLFSICRFREVTGDYPERITVVGFSFKMTRFTQLHRLALRFPPEDFVYVGVDPPEASRDTLDKGEQANSLGPYSRDPYGCSRELQAKREARNPFHRSHGYLFGCPELVPLFNHCGPEIFERDLPWSPAMA